MADHPLRPATRRCLGGPLPLQLADRSARRSQTGIPFVRCPCGLPTLFGISSPFELLSQSLGYVSHVFLTRSPLDLHVYCYTLDLVRLACVKHAASVRPEPGSNSPSRKTRVTHNADKSAKRCRRVEFFEKPVSAYQICICPHRYVLTD